MTGQGRQEGQADGEALPASPWRLSCRSSWLPRCTLVRKEVIPEEEGQLAHCHAMAYRDGLPGQRRGAAWEGSWCDKHTGHERRRESGIQHSSCSRPGPRSQETLGQATRAHRPHRLDGCTGRGTEPSHRPPWDMSGTLRPTNEDSSWRIKGPSTAVPPRGLGRSKTRKSVTAPDSMAASRQSYSVHM